MGLRPTNKDESPNLISADVSASVSILDPGRQFHEQELRQGVNVGFISAAKFGQLLFGLCRSLNSMPEAESSRQSL
jgi:hypothetical protein